MKQWLTYTVTSVVCGFILGYVLLWVWFFVRLVFLGYADSGPSWIITVNDIVFYAGLLIGVVGGQLLFILRERVASFAQKLTKKWRSSKN